MTRWLTGLPLAALLVIAILKVPVVYLKGLIVALSVLGAFEALTLTGSPKKIAGVVMVALATAVAVFLPGFKVILWPLLFIIACVLHFGGKDDFQARTADLFRFFFGVFYIVLLFPFLAHMMDLPGWRFWFFLLLTATFMADTGGYVFGRFLGKHKMAPNLSPGKTIEGFVGGCLFAVGGAFAVRQLISPTFPPVLLIIIALVIAVVGPLGDLSESLLKRGAGLKDSGRFIPGHGGLLDRIDALLFAAPVVFFMARILVK